MSARAVLQRILDAADRNAKLPSGLAAPFAIPTHMLEDARIALAALQDGSDITMRARGTDPDTSHAAARFATTRQKNLAPRVMAVIYAAGARGATKDDLEAALPDIPVVSFSPIPARLVEKDLIVDSGERRIGKCGVAQIVWKAVI